MSGGQHLTDCGLRGIRWIPYGLHACHFYEAREDLAESAIAFCLAGLYLGEKCLWIAAPPLPAADARELLRATWPGCAEALSIGALRIVDYDAWHGGSVDPRRLAEALLAEEEQALREGYRGLRVCGNTAGVLPGEHAAFHEYEHLLSERLRQRRILALCSYQRRASAGVRLGELHRAHHCVFDSTDGWWQVQWPEARASTGA